MSRRRISRWRRRVVVATTSVAALLGGAGPLAAAGPCWDAPVIGVVTDSYRAPACVWCPGNRGIEYEVARGSIVRAVAAGTVTYSGEIAGERYLVVELASGWRLTYGRIASTSLSAGDPVVAGSIVARTSTVFFFGLRIGDEYRDPAPYLGVEVARRRLIPTDGRAPRPAPAPAVRCGNVR
jgi:murein DD-endopeptidase MepM/ murein hydrolase activator NlpD